VAAADLVSAFAVSAVPSKSSEFERDMQMLEAALKRLEAEYNMFFAGRLPRLPWETRARIDALIKQHDRAPQRNTAERFRFSSLQARFVSFCDLWEKQLRAREEGRPPPGRGRRAAAPPPPEGHEPAAKDREQVVHEQRIRDPLEEPERLRELYFELARAREKAGEAQIPFHRFADVVRAQVTKFGGAGQDVSFRVTVKDGKVTLSAKPSE
jgi:hypothetical protein